MIEFGSIELVDSADSFSILKLNVFTCGSRLIRLFKFESEWVQLCAITRKVWWCSAMISINDVRRALLSSCGVGNRTDASVFDLFHSLRRPEEGSRLIRQTNWLWLNTRSPICGTRRHWNLWLNNQPVRTGAVKSDQDAEASSDGPNWLWIRGPLKVTWDGRGCRGERRRLNVFAVNLRHLVEIQMNSFKFVIMRKPALAAKLIGLEAKFRTLLVVQVV